MISIFWIILGVYTLIALFFISRLSYTCCMTYGEFNYTFVSIMAGILWPLWLIFNFISFIVSKINGEGIP